MSGSNGGGANGTEFRTGREADEEQEGQEVTGCQDSGCGPSGEAGQERNGGKRAGCSCWNGHRQQSKTAATHQRP